ncbi:hypothetical protein ACGFJ7_31755 [Actinoplanes sp. NPDC048988]|uniref:hypothetical protein n=1 Tax=Actinoplanes sp. NPDC048988 TaxID=3363901 RepID=UPI003722E795
MLAAGIGVSRVTAYRCRDEAARVLAVTASGLHDTLRRAAADGWSHVIPDGKVFTTGRCAEKHQREGRIAHRYPSIPR